MHQSATGSQKGGWSFVCQTTYLLRREQLKECPYGAVMWLVLTVRHPTHSADLVAAVCICSAQAERETMHSFYHHSAKDEHCLIQRAIVACLRLLLLDAAAQRANLASWP